MSKRRLAEIAASLDDLSMGLNDSHLGDLAAEVLDIATHMPDEAVEAVETDVAGTPTEAAGAVESSPVDDDGADDGADEAHTGPMLFIDQSTGTWGSAEHLVIVDAVAVGASMDNDGGDEFTCYATLDNSSDSEIIDIAKHALAHGYASPALAEQASPQP
jgi:hypothetical protein